MQVAKLLQDELERLARVRVAERLRLTQEPPPHYEEPSSAVPNSRPLYSSSIGTSRSDRSDLVRPSDTDAIRAEIVQLREEFERMLRDREADRMYLPHDPPPIYEERVVLIRRETSAR